MRVTATPHGRLIRFQVSSADGATPEAEIVCRPEPSIRLSAFAAAHGLTVDEMLAAVPTAPRQPASPAQPTSPSPVELAIRPKMRSASADQVRRMDSTQLAAAIREALSSVVDGRDEWVIEWRDTDHAAILDVDWHGSEPPHIDTRRRLAESLRPRPIGWWISHGGGIHALYGAIEPYSAEQLAASAALRALAVDLVCTVEVLPRTSHPRSRRDGELAGDLVWCRATTEITGIGGHGETIDSEDVQAWLLGRGLSVGRYPHEHCTIDPGPSHGVPVVVGTDGIYCHRCAAKRGDGWRPWSVLLGTARDTGWREAVRHAAVWSHVRMTLDPRASVIGAAAYRAALIAAHGADDPRVSAVFRQWRLARADGQWLDSETLLPVLPSVGVEVTRSMPSAWRVIREDGEEPRVEIDTVAHDRHRTNQAIPGYTPIVPVRCAPIWGAHRPYPSGGIRVRRPASDPYPARYLPLSARTAIDECETKLVTWFPGLNLPYLQLLIAARGHAESGIGDPPQIVTTGVTGAAKTATVLLAAAIVGDSVQDVRYGTPERFSEAIADAAAGAGFILLDEYAKDMRAAIRIEAFGLLLSVRREYTFRRLRVGNVRVRVDSVLVVTDTDLGSEIQGHAQYARRAVSVRLLTRCPADWRETCPVRGDVSYLRHDRDAAHVADSYLSWIADACFSRSTGQPTWLDTAKRIGFAPLESSWTSDASPLIRRLHELYTETPPVPDSAVWPGGADAGWRLFDPDSPGELLDIWSALCGPVHTLDDLLRIRRLREVDLARAIGIDGVVEFECRAKGRLIGFRFLNTTP